MVALDSVVSDMFGKSATSITDYLIASDSFDPEHCDSLLHGRLKHRSSEVIQSILGCEISADQKFRMRLIRDHLHYLEDEIAVLDRKLDELVKPYEDAISLLCTIPGVDRHSAIAIISEIGVDMAQFGSAKRLCCWAGLTPTNNESAGKKKTVRIARAGVYLKPALVQVALASVQSNAYYRSKYERISRRRGKKRAVIAIARMILTAVYHMLAAGEAWCPTDLYTVDLPQLQISQKAIATQQAIKLLLAQGITDLREFVAA